MYTEESLNARLANIAINRASQMEFSPGCKRSVFRSIEYGAHHIASKGLLADKAEIKKAEDNIDRFISEMILEAERRGYGSMHEDIYKAIMTKLCPIWPICQSKYP